MTKRVKINNKMHLINGILIEKYPIEFQLDYGHKLCKILANVLYVVMI